MFKSEKIFLFLLISVCLIISLSVIDSLMDPAVLFRTAYARFAGEGAGASLDVYLPDQESEEDSPQLLGQVTDSLQEGWSRFQSEGYAFAIEFPKQVVRKSILNQDALNTGVGLEPEAPVWQFRLEDSGLYQGTNLVEASVLIHVLEGKDQEAACGDFLPGSIYQTPAQQRDSLPEVEINGIPFLEDQVVEGVMGEFYHRISYRTFTKGACYEISQLIHYRNLDSVQDENTVQFDEDKVMAELDKVIQTFTLLDVEPTFPVQSYPEPKALSTAVSKAASEYVDGLDVSHWQGTINWTKVANAGYVFTFVKGTEGVGWTDVKFHENMVNGANAGVKMGVYHFARPDLGNSAVDEANHFLEVSGDYLNSGYLRPVLDLEVGSSMGKTALSNWVLKWMETVENRTGISPLIYTNPNFINYYLTDAVTKYDLWVAHWTCEPTPSYYYPNTGKWRDWAFWQYYGPGGCGGNAGYVPGITTNVDLNIFNGVESGLQEYDASSHLWVSLTSDAYYYPTPYFADITGNVNGDTTGLIDFDFWWDCQSLESDSALVEGTCGALPEPESGTCQYNDVGMRCIDVENEKQVAEHTYSEIGNYTAKVIVHRGDEPPVEDRYKITTYNPIRSTKLDPPSPNVAVIDDPYTLQADVNLHTSQAGVLQVSLQEEVSGAIVDSQCIPVVGDNESTESFAFTWSQSQASEKNYEVWTRYRPQGECPIADESPDDLVQYYQIYWMDEKPVLQLQDSEGKAIPDGSVDQLEGVDPSQPVQLAYTILNPSAIKAFQISDIRFENLSNVTDLQVEPAAPLTVDPDGQAALTISFTVGSGEGFAFDLVMDHDASNPTPFRITVQGGAAQLPNPIQSIEALPPSPGENLIGNTYDLHVDVALDSPAEGALQVSVVDQAGGSAADPLCISVPGGVLDSYGFDFSWEKESSGLSEYQIWARYREQGPCPIQDTSEADISSPYQIDWQEDSPLLALESPDQESISAGGVDAVGDQLPYQVIERTYLVSNPSTTTSFEITNVSFSSLENLSGLVTPTSLPLVIDPEGQASLVLRYEVENPGQFGGTVALEHSASNPTPFTFRFEGTGVIGANPIQSIQPEPLSPGQALIGTQYSLQIGVDLDAPVEGALQITVEGEDGNPVETPYCEEVSNPGSGAYSYAVSWSEPDPRLAGYSITADYYARVGCPASGIPIGELTQNYQIDWGVETPALEVLNPQGNLLPAGEEVSLGQYGYYQNGTLNLQLQNSSSTSPLGVTDIRIENPINISQVALQTGSAMTLDPDSSSDLDLSFQVTAIGDFSFDLVIEHDGGNDSPYRIPFQGSGVMIDNPIQYVLPVQSSPGSSLIGTPYILDVEVGLDAPDAGALQISLMDGDSGQLVVRSCQNVVDNLEQARMLSLALNQSAPGSRDYELVAKYRAQESCPIEDSQEGDLSQSYAILWIEEKPSLVVARENEVEQPAQTVQDLGEQAFYQTIELGYKLRNTSSTTSLNLDALGVENAVNVDQVVINPSGPITIGPGGELTVQLSFRVAGVGAFSLDFALDHNGENPSPYQFTIAGTGVMADNPILGLTTSPEAPGSSYVNQEYALQARVEIDPPAPGILTVSLKRQDTAALMGQTCFEILGESSFIDVDLNWKETNPGDILYDIQVGYQALASCPLEGDPDAVLTQSYQVTWLTHQPELIVNRPEGVTIFDGAVDYIGRHDFFRFVEVTYRITNGSDTEPLIIQDITPKDLENLREVLVEPNGVIEIQPGESQDIKITFQVLTLDPYSFDLVWEHNGSNPSPYVTSIMGDARLNLGDAPQASWLYRFLESLIKSGFFLKLPILSLILVRRIRRD